jgi:hypothetical protein
LVVFATLCGVNITSAQQGDARGFNLIVVGDSQPQTKAHLESLEQEIIPQIGVIVEEYRAESELPIAILLTGDVVWDTTKYLPRVKRAFESLGVPVYAVIGNHDHNKRHERNQKKAERDYVEAWGARNQAFMLGETLFVTLDNIDYTDHTKYGLKVDADQLIWLSEVMDEYTDVEHVAVCMHAPATSHRTGGFIPYAKPIIRILGERKIDLITGHGHRHFTADHAPNIIEHSVAQVSGNLWFAPICADGTPQGVFCIEEREGEWTWHHRIFGRSANEPLIAYPVGRVAEHEEYAVIKVVGWDSKWQLSWSENGVDMGAMEQIAILDPDYTYYVENEAQYRKKYMDRLRRSARPHRHYFRCKPTDPNSKITITATDRFGRVYSVEM